jgi:hypothetical protein
MEQNFKSSYNKRYLYYRLVRAKLSLSLRHPHTAAFYFFSYLRSFKGGKQDTVIISYPKSGRTWVDQLLVHVARFEYHLEEREAEQYESLHKIDQRFPPVQFTHAGSSWEEYPILDENEILKVTPDNYIQARKGIFLYRDPRDILVSSYYHIKNRTGIRRISRNDMIGSKYFGLRKIIGFMNMWIDFSRNRNSCLLTSYESLKNNTHGELEKICAFIGMRYSKSTLKKSVEACEFSKMKHREQSGAYRSPRLSAIDTKNQQSYKVRRGTMRQYEDFFSKEELEVIDRIIERELDNFFPYKAKTN